MEEPVSLKSLIIPHKEVDIEFPGYDDFIITLCFLGRDEKTKLVKKCTKTEYNKKTHQPMEIFDEDKFLTEFTKAVIKGWRGLKYEYLQEFALVDVSNQNPEDELPYTQENAEVLVHHSDNFDNWVVEVVGDLENFTKDNKKEL